MSVLLETSLGDIVIDLEIKRAPRACLNFIKLCKTKAYNCTLFHSIDKGFTAQSGIINATSESVWSHLSPPKKYFCPEVSTKLKHKARGVVSYSTAFTKEGVIFAGSQFFITLSETPLTNLDSQHAIFGHVVEGCDVLDRINNTLVDTNQRPFHDIWIKHTVILDDPFQDPHGLVIPPKSPMPSSEFLETLRVPDTVNETHDSILDATSLDRKQRIEDADARALTLEMIGDLPFAEIDPPDTILFVCKLNFITQDDDLELIFSRFGDIIECKVVRDDKGKSKGFAFIEFATREACEQAYFKMDNVLIDDKRIKVDFSQSVGKMNFSMNGIFMILVSYEQGERGVKEGVKYHEVGHDDKYDLVYEEERSAPRKSSNKRSRSRERDQRSRRDRSDSRGRNRRRSRSRERSRGSRRR